MDERDGMEILSFEAVVEALTELKIRQAWAA